MIKKFITFLKNVKSELAYVSWPSRADLKEGTTVVIVMSVIVAVFLSLVDAGFGELIKLVLFRG